MQGIKRLLSTLTSVVTTRLALLANELQEERLRLVQILILALVTVFCFSVAILLLIIFLVVLFWDDHRLGVLSGLSLLFFIFGTWMAVMLRNKLCAGSKLFSASLAELTKDREQLGAADHE